MFCFSNWQVSNLESCLIVFGPYELLYVINCIFKDQKSLNFVGCCFSECVLWSTNMHAPIVFAFVLHIAHINAFDTY